MDYPALNDAVFALYDDARFADALDLVRAQRGHLGAHDAEVALLAACLHGRLGEPSAALAELASSLGRGGWWDPSVLVEDDDLAGLADLPGWPELVAGSTARWEAAHVTPDRSGDVLVVPPDPGGVLVALHGAEETAADAVAVWGPVAEAAGLALLAVRSSRRFSPAYRSWPDRDLAAREVGDAWAALPEHLRAVPVAAAGFSAGGRVALRLATHPGEVPVGLVLAVAPAIGAEDLSVAAPAVGGAVWIGSEDGLLPDLQELRPGLEAAGIALHVVPGLCHAAPADLVDLAVPLLHDHVSRDRG